MDGGCRHRRRRRLAGDGCSGLGWIIFWALWVFFFFSSFRFLLVGNALIETFGGEKMGENVCLGGEK